MNYHLQPNEYFNHAPFPCPHRAISDVCPKCCRMYFFSDFSFLEKDIAGQKEMTPFFKTFSCMPKVLNYVAVGSVQHTIFYSAEGSHQVYNFKALTPSGKIEKVVATKTEGTMAHPDNTHVKSIERVQVGNLKQWLKKLSGFEIRVES